jgi:hypothetical protein
VRQEGATARCAEAARVALSVELQPSVRSFSFDSRTLSRTAIVSAATSRSVVLLKTLPPEEPLHREGPRRSGAEQASTRGENNQTRTGAFLLGSHHTRRFSAPPGMLSSSPATSIRLKGDADTAVHADSGSALVEGPALLFRDLTTRGCCSQWTLGGAAVGSRTRMSLGPIHMPRRRCGWAFGRATRIAVPGPRPHARPPWIWTLRGAAVGSYERLPLGRIHTFGRGFKVGIWRCCSGLMRVAVHQYSAATR